MKRMFLALAMLGLAHTASADITVSDVRVGIYFSYNPATFTAQTVNWHLPVTIKPGQKLILAQNNGAYSFDTSDAGCAGYPLDLRLCDAGWALLSVVIDGRLLNLWDNERVLTLKGRDPLDPANEAQGMKVACIGDGFIIKLGYGDNIHTDECGSYANSIGLVGNPRCLPDEFETATHRQFIGVPLQAGLVQTQPWHCVYGNPFHPCFDTGIVEFDVPEVLASTHGPASLVLLSFGLLGAIVVCGGRRK